MPTSHPDLDVLLIAIEAVTGIDGERVPIEHWHESGHSGSTLTEAETAISLRIIGGTDV